MGKMGKIRLKRINSHRLLNKSFNPETFDPGHLDISSKYDKTLEETMFEEDLPLDVGLSYMDETPKTPKKFKRRMYNDMDKDEFEKELLHMCTFCDSSFKDLPALKTHIKRHQNVLPLALYVTREESFVRSYNNKKKTKSKKTEDLDAAPSELTQVRNIWVFSPLFPQNERRLY